MLIAVFNMTIESKNVFVFMSLFDLEYSIKKLTCFQSKIPSCIDLILTSKKNLFKRSGWEFRPSQFHHYRFEKSASQRKPKNTIIL